MEAFEVGRGDYDDYQALAVFAVEAEAHAFIDWWNLTHLDEIAAHGQPAHFNGAVEFHGPGWLPPRESQVIEGDVIDADQWARALPFREAAEHFGA